jgi:16S rRNA (cytidine1402-2'-O)-methyltransferase
MAARTGGEVSAPPATAAGRLWIVATPIGTLGDLGQRAREVLGAVDLILAEDTRRTRALLSHAGIAAGRRLLSLRRENEASLVPKVASLLEAGREVALVSDAGTPVLQDPGFLLLREARRRGVQVCSVPGPSAFTAALAVSGQVPLPATLVGFLPARGPARRQRVAELASLPWSLVLLLSPHRLRRELEDLAAGLGPGRPATLLAELSKVHERAVVGDLGELAESAEVESPRGEYVLVVGAAAVVAEAPANHPGEVIRAAYERALAETGARPEALRLAARRLGLKRGDVYRALVDGDQRS